MKDLHGNTRLYGRIRSRRIQGSETALFAVSLISRRRKSRSATRILRALGYGLMTTAANLGGEMIYTHRVGVDRTSGQTFPADFVSVLAESELAESQPKRAEHDGVPILLVRRGIPNLCSR